MFNPFPGNRPPQFPPQQPQWPLQPQQPPHRPPQDGGHGHGRRESAPTTPPPDFIPPQTRQARAVDAGAIRGCLRSFMYVWLTNGQAFWMFPTFVGRRSVAGYRWSRFGWVYTGFDLRMVASFHCMR